MAGEKHEVIDGLESRGFFEYKVNFVCILPDSTCTGADADKGDDAALEILSGVLCRLHHDILPLARRTM